MPTFRGQRGHNINIPRILRIPCILCHDTSQYANIHITHFPRGYFPFSSPLGRDGWSKGRKAQRYNAVSGPPVWRQDISLGSRRARGQPILESPIVNKCECNTLKFGEGGNPPVDPAQCDIGELNLGNSEDKPMFRLTNRLLERTLYTRNKGASDYEDKDTLGIIGRARHYS